MTRQVVLEGRGNWTLVGERVWLHLASSLAIIAAQHAFTPRVPSETCVCGVLHWIFCKRTTPSMSRFFLAIQVWWRTLVDAEFGRQVAELLSEKPAAPELPAPLAAHCCDESRSDGAETAAGSQAAAAK